MNLTNSRTNNKRKQILHVCGCTALSGFACDLFSFLVYLLLCSMNVCAEFYISRAGGWENPHYPAV